MIKKSTIFERKIQIIMETIVQDYRKLVENLPSKIQKSAFKPKAFIKMLGMPSATFYNRMKNRNFSIDETEKLVKILEMENDLEKSLAKGLAEANEGRVIDGGEVLSNLK